MGNDLIDLFKHKVSRHTTTVFYVKEGSNMTLNY